MTATEAAGGGKRENTEAVDVVLVVHLENGGSGRQRSRLDAGRAARRARRPQTTMTKISLKNSC